MNKRLVLALLVLGSVSSACAPDFIEQWDIRKPRHFVAKVSVDGDSEGRTRPRPGESVSVRFFMLSPERAQDDYTGELSVCLGAALPNGSVVCLQEQELPAGLGSAQYEGNDQLTVSHLPVPQEIDQLPPELDRVTLIGSFCANGQVERVPGKSAVDDPVSSLYRCIDNDDADYKPQLPFTSTLWLDRGQEGTQNHNPSFDCDPNELSGPCHEGIEHDGSTVPGAFVLELPKPKGGGSHVTLPWEAWDESQPLPWENCADAPDSLPKLHAGDKDHKIRVRFDASDRETFERTVSVNGSNRREMRREDLVISHAISQYGGELPRYESVIYYDDEDAEAEIEVTYTPPKKRPKNPAARVPETGRLVRFYFALRDLRGGADFTTRELCVLPAVEP